MIHSKELAKWIKIFWFRLKKNFMHLKGKTFGPNVAPWSSSVRSGAIIFSGPMSWVEAKEPQLSALYWLFLCIYTRRWRKALRPSALSPAHFEALSAARAATGGPATIHESLREFSFDIFQLDPKYYSPALYLKCHTEQQIAQRLLQAVPVTDNLWFGL